MLDTTHQTDERYCLFRSGASWFALPAVTVQEVSFRPVITPVATSVPVLAGLCHFRSEFLAVLSLRCLLPDVSSVHTPESQIVVVQGSDGPWALLVDQVLALEPLDASSSADSLDASNDDDWADVVSAWATFRDHSVRILDPEMFYRLADQALHESWQWPGQSGLLTEQSLATANTTRNVEPATN